MGEWEAGKMELARQQVVVGEAGQIVIQVPQLPPGTRAEVIVVEQPQGERPHVRRADLIASCPGMFSSPHEADAFLSRERDARGS
jgi:hypothetical protein